MKKNWIMSKTLFFVIIFLFLSSSTISIGQLSLVSEPLPPPRSVDMSLECVMSRRLSIRAFTDESVNMEDLSTVLWAAYGYRDDHQRTAPGIEETHAAHIYVLTEDAVYKYDAFNHSLILYKTGDNRSDVAQYEAPIQLGIVWDTSQSPFENYTGAEIGQIGQNIQFMALALGLGSVVTGERPSPLDKIGLPAHEVGKIVMPLGHPQNPYTHHYRPLWVSPLPRIISSDISLTTILEERTRASSFEGTLTRQELSQVLWASYGYSPFIERREQEENPLKRHRTVPSAHGYYPLRMYAVAETGVYRYIPGLLDIYRWGLPIVTYLLKTRMGDHRVEIADASQSSIATAPLLIVSVLDVEKTNQWDDLSGPEIRWIWHYEAGASAHNVLLEATAWDLSAAIVPVHDVTAVQVALGLDDNFLPLYIVPVGKV